MDIQLYMEFQGDIEPNDGMFLFVPELAIVDTTTMPGLNETPDALTLNKINMLHQIEWEEENELQ